ncbi:hypothetical protein BHE74_00013308, partial [Ensete ventricosum]
EDTVVSKQVVERGEKATTSPVGLSYPKVKHRLERRWTRRSTTVPQRRIYRSRRKGYRCKLMDSRDMGLAAPWYCRGGTSVESSIPCFYGGRALVVKRGPRSQKYPSEAFLSEVRREGMQALKHFTLSLVVFLAAVLCSSHAANMQFRPKRAASDHLTPEHSCKQPRYAYADEADVF